MLKLSMKSKYLLATVFSGPLKIFFPIEKIHKKTFNYFSRFLSNHRADKDHLRFI